MGLKQYLFKNELEKIERITNKINRLKEIDKKCSYNRKKIRQIMTDINNLATRITKLEIKHIKENKK